MATNKLIKYSFAIDFVINAFIWEYFKWIVLMYLVYQLTGYISGLLINFNFLGPVIAPWLHCYFDVFAGCIQTLVFVTLSSILIMMENPD